MSGEQADNKRGFAGPHLHTLRYMEICSKALSAMAEFVGRLSAFVLVPQPTFGQQAQTEFLGLREIGFWVATGHSPPLGSVPLLRDDGAIYICTQEWPSAAYLFPPNLPASVPTT